MVQTKSAKRRKKRQGSQYVQLLDKYEALKRENVEALATLAESKALVEGLLTEVNAAVGKYECAKVARETAEEALAIQEHRTAAMDAAYYAERERVQKYRTAFWVAAGVAALSPLLLLL